MHTAYNMPTANCQLYACCYCTAYTAYTTYYCLLSILPIYYTDAYCLLPTAYCSLLHTPVLPATVRYRLLYTAYVPYTAYHLDACLPRYTASSVCISTAYCLLMPTGCLRTAYCKDMTENKQARLTAYIQPIQPSAYWLPTHTVLPAAYNLLLVRVQYLCNLLQFTCYLLPTTTVPTTVDATHCAVLYFSTKVQNQQNEPRPSPNAAMLGRVLPKGLIYPYIRRLKLVRVAA